VSKYILFTKAFWADTTERVISTAAQAVVAVVAAAQVTPNAFTLDYKVLAGVAAGGAIAALAKALAKLGATAQVPVEPTPIRSGGDVEREVPTPTYDEAFPAVVTDETVGLSNH
jgi:hypothetical protein